MSPVLSPDELTIYFTTNSHVVVATRPDKSSPFGAATPVAAVNDSSAVADYPTWISADGCVLATYRVTYSNNYFANVMVAKRSL